MIKNRRKTFESVSYDKALFLLILSLVSFGVAMVYNVSTVFAHNVFGGRFYFLILQSSWGIIGLFALLIFRKLDYHKLLKLSPFFLLLTLIFMVLVVLPTPFTPEIYGARRWFFINPSPFPEIPGLGRLGFQPSELIKLSLILYLSYILPKKKNFFVGFLVLVGFILGLVMLQPDLGTALLISSIAASMYFVSGAELKKFFVGVPVFVLAVVMFILGSPYRRQRLLTYFSEGFSDTQGSSYHINQILIALGSGGIFGLGFGQSRQKFEYIPEVATDSIFAIIGEELGFVGAFILLSVMFAVVYKGFQTSKTAPDLEGSLLAVGITTWFATQCVVNLASMVHLIPLTGVPLPLISYGGSSMVFGLCALGVLLNISSQAAK